jgi:hypothetical protein
MEVSHLKESNLCQKNLKELLSYNEETGEFYWLRRPDLNRASKIFNSKYAGKRAGVESPRKYRYIRMRGIGFFSESRLAWLYVTGQWPSGEIDHINGDPSDNRFVNLRVASRSQNGANRGIHSNNQSGFKGVTKARNKWTAEVSFQKKKLRLGRFNTPQEAYAAYLGASKAFHGEFAKP